MRVSTVLVHADYVFSICSLENMKIFTGLGQVGVRRVGAHPVCRAEKPNLFIFYFKG